MENEFRKHPKVVEAKRLMNEAWDEIRKNETAERGRDSCKCGHERKEHNPSHNINYTNGSCRIENASALIIYIKNSMYFHSKWEEGYIAYYRFWWSFGRRLGISGDANFFSRSCGIALSVGNDHIQFYVGIPLIGSFWLTLGDGDEDAKEISIKFHNWALWWSIWRDSMGGWSSRESKWRVGSIHFDNIIFGKAAYSSEILEERDIVVPMPEKSYAAKATRTMDRWKYPRWFTKEIMRVQIEVPEGIPHEGKGENSWDCGPDATYSMMTSAKSIAEAVGKMVGSSLHDRVRYGGWDDWTWTKERIV